MAERVEVVTMSEREEGYRAAKEAREGFVHRTRQGSRSSAASVTGMVNAAVYRYEHRVPEGPPGEDAESLEFTEKDPVDPVTRARHSERPHVRSNHTFVRGSVRTSETANVHMRGA